MKYKNIEEVVDDTELGDLSVRASNVYDHFIRKAAKEMGYTTPDEIKKVEARVMRYVNRFIVYEQMGLL